MKRPDISTEGARILIVDDVPANLRILSEALESKGYRIQAATDGETALKIIEAGAPELVLLDVMMPGINGYETCRRMKKMPGMEHIPVLFITALNETEDIVEGFDAGGMDYLTKPFSEAEVHARVNTHLRVGRLTRALEERNVELEQAIHERRQAERTTAHLSRQLEIIAEQDADRWGYAGIIGDSPQLEAIFKQVQLLQKSERTSALVTGESGTGKEMIARAIHHGGVRSKGPFIAMNCSAIPRELVESTLFGHMKGSFTGAASDKQGLFELAHGGTLFLDEIGEMPLDLQAKLLRVLESGTFTPVGASAEKKSDVRIIAATHVNFAARMEEGTFREDLYYRLARFVIDLPPLRERSEDIPLLATHFAEYFSSELGYAHTVPISQEALERLRQHSFPGNIRELKNIMERAVLESGGEHISSDHLHFLTMRTAQYPQPSSQVQASGSSKPYDAEKLMNKRSSSPGADNLESDESQIMQYVREHGMINNTDCRELLEIDRHRANYLLKKLNQYGLLQIVGTGRWAVYRLNGH